MNGSSGTTTSTATTSTKPTTTLKSVAVIAQEVLDGKWGNGGEREEKLTAAGYNYDEVQAEVNRLVKNNSTTTSTPTTSTKPTTSTANTKKTNEEIAYEVVQGKWGAGAERKTKLQAAGYNYTEVQAIVSKIMSGEKVTVSTPTVSTATTSAQTSTSVAFNPYVVKVTISNLNIRRGPGTNYNIIGTMPKGGFTIVEEADGQGANKWGLLKAYSSKRNGWISLDHVTKS